MRLVWLLVLKANVLMDGQPTLLLGLSPINQRRMSFDRPIVVDGDGPLRLPHMLVILCCEKTHQRIVDKITAAYPGMIPQYGGGMETIGRPLRIPFRARGRVGFRSRGRVGLMLGFSAADLALLGDGAIYHVDGKGCQVPEVKLCVVGLDTESDDMSVAQMKALTGRCETEGIRL